jgi:hypothetical protein
MNQGAILSNGSNDPSPEGPIGAANEKIREDVGFSVSLSFRTPAARGLGHHYWTDKVPLKVRLSRSKKPSREDQGLSVENLKKEGGSTPLQGEASLWPV